MTGIEYVDETWNPVTGCSWVSTGCDNCYARRLAKRFGWDFRPTVHLERLDEPLHWRKPRRILVPSMGDLFHRDIPLYAIAAVWATVYVAKQHTFFVLTKRPLRALGLKAKRIIYPMPNLYLGVTVENQDAVWRLGWTPVMQMWISAEPLLGPVSLDLPDSGVEWVVVGGESGPGARPMKLEWAQQIVNDCREAGVPVFVKQLGNVLAKELGLKSRKGSDPAEWPESLRVREFPVKE